MCSLAGSEFSADAVKKHRETVINALKVTYKVLQYNLFVCTYIQFQSETGDMIFAAMWKYRYH